MGKPSPLSRSLGYAREALGWTVGKTEHWNSHAGIRQDLFGFVDALAMTGGRFVAIQACGGSGVSSHKAKIETEPRAHEWLESGGSIELWAWRKTKLRRGSKAWRWSVRRIAASLGSEGVEWQEIEA